MKILITGASGFIGSHLIGKLQPGQGSAHEAYAHQVYAMMRATSNPRNLEGATFEKKEGDLGDFESLKRAVFGMDVVIHLAGAITAKNREEFFKHNAQGTENLARAVVESGTKLKRFVYVSSLAAAGPAPDLCHPRSSSRPDLGGENPNPVSIYGESKLAGETALLAFKSKFPVTIIRPPIVYGPKDRNVLFIVQTVAKGFVPKFPTQGPEGKKFYSAVHAEDLCNGILLAAFADEQKSPSGSVYYLCSDEIFSDQEFMGTMADAIGKKPISFRVPRWALGGVASLCSWAGQVRGKDFAFNRDKLNELMPDYWICSNQEAKIQIGFSARYDFKRGMTETIKWYQQQGWI